MGPPEGLLDGTEEGRNVGENVGAADAVGALDVVGALELVGAAVVGVAVGWGVGAKVYTVGDELGIVDGRVEG